ncbi:MAG: hypothetical protein IJG84_20855 [Kiritimatiellae bacterium]|nr:hypothetical protein [Kiritimatiellia bacterium]
MKSRMYASKLLTERSPVAKRVMIAEANTDAPKSFCDAPGGTGHSDMARSESPARELGRPAAAKAGAGVGGNRSSDEAGNDRGVKGSRIGSASNRSAGADSLRKKRMARFLNRKSQRYYRLKFADTYYGEMTHYGLHRLAWADVRRIRN